MKIRIRNSKIGIGTICILLEFIIVNYVIFTRYHYFIRQEYIYYLAIGSMEIISLLLILRRGAITNKEIVLLMSAVYMMIVTMIERGICNDCFVAASSIFSLFIGFNIADSLFENRKLYCVLYLLTLILFFMNFKVNYYQVVWQGRTNFSEAQLLIFLAPLIFYFIEGFGGRKSLRYEILFSIILLGFVFISFKRTSLVVVSLSLFVYYYLKYVKGKQSKNRRILFVFLFVVLFVLIVILNDYTENFFVYRFSIALKTGGNGRLDLWKNTLDAFGESNMLEKLIGHGFDAVEANLGQSAHNEYIEILYDFGIIGFIIFLSMIILLFKCYRKSFNKPVFAFAVVSMLVSMMFSHIIIYPKFSNSMMITLGALISISKHERLLYHE